MPMGKLRFTQSASGRTFHSWKSVVRRGELLDLLDDDFLHDVHQAVADIGGVDDLVAEAVDDFALLVHHVVVFERAFADLEVVLLDALLGLARWSG